MQKFILAVSPDAKLLLQIQAHLQEGGRFSVICAHSGEEALTTLGSQSFDLAILDGDLSDIPFVPFTRELITLAPDLKLLVFPPQNNSRHPVLNGLIANGFLNKPFFGPEVSEKIAHALNVKNIAAPQNSNDEEDVARTWIQNPEAGAKQIEQLLASTSASAGLLLLRGHVLASSGVLSDETGSNIVNYLNRYWSNIQSGELFRYLTMEHEASSYIIYAAPLIKDTAIALIYHTQKPLQEIRTEVARLRKAFLDRYTNTHELRNDFASQTSAETTSSLKTPPEPEKSQMVTHNLSGPSVNENPAVFPLAEEGEGEGLTEKEIQNLNNLLSEMPPPDPDEGNLVSEGISSINNGSQIFTNGLNSEGGNQINLHEESQFDEVKEPTELMAESLSESGKTAPLPHREPMTPVPEPESFPNFDFKLPWEEDSLTGSNQLKKPNSVPPPLPVIPPSGNNHPTFNVESSLTGANERNVIVPFTFILFPRNASQFITKDMASLFNQKLGQIHRNFNWPLTAISIRPLYLQWSSLLPPFSCIPEKLSDIRLQLNTMIFTANPDLLKSNVEGDFWLPGYIALSGFQPPSNRMINDFILLFRQVEPQLQS